MGRFCAIRARCLSAVILLTSFVAAPARAQDEVVEDPHALQVHGFVSQGFLKSTQNNYLAYSKRGSFQFSEVGINFSKNVSDDLRIGMQLFAHELGPQGQLSPQFDWFNLDYRVADWLGLRVGRTKIPFGLYNDSADIDSARVPVLLPQSIYPIDHRDYLLAQTGAELYGNVELDALGSFEYRGYGGTLHLATPAAPAPGITLSNVNVPYVYGGRGLWSTPLEGLTLGASYQALRFDWQYNIDAALITPLQAAGYLPPGFGGALPVKFRVKLWVASLEYQLGDLTLASEYSRWIGSFESIAPKLLPERVVNERYYAMASYRVTRWFTPGLYYSVYFPDTKHRSGRADYQRDAALSLRYDLSSHWLLKLEGHYMNGTAALDLSLNDNKDPKTLTKDWAMLVVKTTAYF